MIKKKRKRKETTKRFCTEKWRGSARGRRRERELQEKRQTERTNPPEWRTDEVREVLS